MNTAMNNNIQPYKHAGIPSHGGDRGGPRRCIRLGTGLFVLCLLLSVSSPAQTFFNRLYTLQATAASFEAVAPHGDAGGFMAAATVRDSGTGLQAIRIGRFDAAGTEQASAYFNIPDDTARSIYVNIKAMTRVHDNCYAMAGSVL
ncbi:MAG: hypothetical protein JNL13_13480, partial [Chitinophagaceae bacterium]|nr:hypothetical protein [Chitinophagaceae bacterium]